MTRKLFTAVIMTLAVFLTLGTAYAQQGQQKAPSASQQQPQAQQNGWYCPWCGSYGGPHCSGMMRGYGMGYGMGPGMMQHGYGMGTQGRYGMGMRYGQQGGQPLSEAQIKTLLQNYVAGTNNPNLKVGKITKAPGKDYYVAEITTKDGSLVDKIDVNEYTGWFRSAYTE